MGDSEQLGKFIVLQDAYGNQLHLRASRGDREGPPGGAAGRAFREGLPAHQTPNRTPRRASRHRPGTTRTRAGRRAKAKSKAASGPQNTEELRNRLFALPQRSGNADTAGVPGQLDQLLGRAVPGYETFKSAFAPSFQFDQKTMELKPLKVGSKVTGGTVIGRVGQPDAAPPHLNFAIRPAGRGAPTIDPKPILDGWKLLETTAIYRAADKNPSRRTRRSARSC